METASLVRVRLKHGNCAARRQSARGIAWEIVRPRGEYGKVGWLEYLLTALFVARFAYLGT